MKQLVAFAGPWVGWVPEQSVVDNEKIGSAGNGEFHGSEGGIDASGNAGDRAVVFDLEAVEGAIIVLDIGGAE